MSVCDNQKGIRFLKILYLSHICDIMEVHEKINKIIKNLALVGDMYKFEQYRQLGLTDFDQSVGLKMNPENR